MSFQLGAGPLAAHATQAAELAAVLRDHPGAAAAFAELTAAMGQLGAEDHLDDTEDVLDPDLLTLTLGESPPLPQRMARLSA